MRTDCESPKSSSSEEEETGGSESRCRSSCEACATSPIVPVVAAALIGGSIAGAVLYNRLMQHPIACTDPRLPMITAVLEQPDERSFGVIVGCLAMPFNFLFAYSAWRFLQDTGGRQAGTPWSDVIGPVNCALGGLTYLIMVAVNDRSYDPKHKLHLSMVAVLVVNEALFLGCSLRSLRRRLQRGLCSKRLAAKSCLVVSFRRLVLATCFLCVLVFGATVFAGTKQRTCKSYRDVALYSAIAEYTCVFCTLLQYCAHAYELHLERGE